MGEAGLRCARALAAIGLAVSLGGCARDYLPVDQAGRHTALPPPAAPATASPSPPPAEPAPAAAASNPTAAPSPAPPANDTCGAAGLMYLIGKPKTEIPVATDLSRRRVTCSTCAVTEDYRPDRVTIVFDQTTGLVQAVKCG